MFPTQEPFINAEIDYRVERMIADREATRQRREARQASRRAKRSVRGQGAGSRHAAPAR